MTSGFYARGDGWLHRLDTRVKVLLSLCIVACCAIWGNWIFLAAMLVAIHAMFLTDRTPLYALGRCWAGVGTVCLVVFVILLASLGHVGTDVLCQVGGWRLTAQALALDGTILLRIADFAFALLLTLVTTSDEQWTRGFAALHLPYRATHAWLTGLHEIPAVFVNARRTRIIQAARGASLGIASRIRAWIGAWRIQSERNDDIDTAMRTRGLYLDRHGAPRTLANPAHMRAADWVTLLVTVALTGGVITMVALGW